MTEKKPRRSQSRRRSDAAYRNGYLAGQQAALTESVINEARIKLLEKIRSEACAANPYRSGRCAYLMVWFLADRPALVPRFMAEGINVFVPSEAELLDLKESRMSPRFHKSLAVIDGEWCSILDFAREQGITS